MNREKYEQFIHASRLYATAKAYWQYERSPLKTLAYILLAPLQLAGSAVRRGNISALLSAFQSTVLAGRYLLSFALSWSLRGNPILGKARISKTGESSDCFVGASPEVAVSKFINYDRTNH